ncbi:MAG: hypothetical protein HC927_10330 [Deltaproteobacteria bacterium]|nr:hypothetical protein [Deltaproteobacteria bacterium]
MLRIFWLTHLCCCIARAQPDLPPLPAGLRECWEVYINDPQRWVSLANQHLGPLSSWLDSLDAALRERDQTIFVLYDHLDKIGIYDRSIRHRFAATLLGLWMSLTNRYTHLRAKIFLREDIFEATQQSFADASKLQSRSLSLDWDLPSLFRMLIRHMVAASPDLREWIQRGTKGIALTEHTILGWMPPERMPEKGKNSQKNLIDHLAGEMMGKGLKKGYTYRWIPNRLQDAHVRVVPRSLLNLIGFAAEAALPQGSARGDRLLTPDDLQRALAKTSSYRVAELVEEHKVVRRLENLRGVTVMLDPETVAARLARPLGSEDDRFGDDGHAVRDELVRLGVLSVRPDGRIDVPDIYRYGFGIKRKGGVKRPA